MCGIAGYVGTAPLDEERISRCLSLMHHRGPDASGWREFRHPSGQRTYLLHTRLAIIDLDAKANQPMHVNGRWIVFNGELYNYRELRATLEAAGERFQSSSDTEVLVRSLNAWGHGALDRFEGMWAFASYEEASGELMLCRDRFGEKPLFLMRTEDGLFFASEIKFLFALCARSAVNLRQIKRYLVNGYKSLYKTRETFFEGVEELPAATRLTVRPGQAPAPETYWRLEFRPEDAITFDDAVAGVRERLIRSMELRLRADVPIAFCMSGGVDSNALLAIASRKLNYDVHGFTISSGDDRYDEGQLTVEIAREMGLRHTLIRVETDRFLPRLRELVAAHDAPVSTITYFAHWLIEQQVAAHGYKVSVSGTGADELLSGYYDHHLAYLREVRWDADRWRTAVEEWKACVQPHVRNPYLADPDRFVTDPGFRDHIFLNAEEFAGYLCDPWSEPFTENHYTEDLLRNRMMNELFHESVPVILHEDDLNAMSVSVENRSPFLDRDLCEFCYRIPTRHLVRHGRAKEILREAARGIATNLVLDNPRKVGFNLPVHACLDTTLPEVRDELLSDAPVFQVVRRDRIEELLERPALSNSESKLLFNFVNARLFMDHYAS